jgi:outer membrane receptor protein involved in Fe transport
VGDLAFEPEEAEGFEGGIKAMLLDRQLRLGLSVYSYKYKDLQVDFFNSAITTFVTFNAGSAKTRGVEAEFEWAPDALDGFALRGTASYGDAFYSSFPGAPCFAGQTPAQGCLAATTAIPYLHQDLKGVDTALAPSWTGSLGFDYDRVVGGFRYGVSGNAKFSGAYFVSPFGNSVDRQDSYVTLDAALRFGDEEGHWEVAFIGKNLTNEYILTYGQDAPSTGAGTGTAAGVPADQFGFALAKRTVAVQFTYRY